MVEVRKPEGIPTNKNTAAIRTRAATAAPAYFNALMSTFPGQTTSCPAWQDLTPTRLALVSLSPNGENAQKGLKIIRGAAKLCDLWHTSPVVKILKQPIPGS